MHLDGLMIEFFFSHFLIGRNGKKRRTISAQHINQCCLFHEKYIILFLRKYIERSLYIYAKCKNVHPVFEKLEFYLNLKNDFALTFYTRRA